MTMITEVGPYSGFQTARENAMLAPSGDQAGPASPGAELASRVTPEPSAFMTEIPASAPSVRNTILPPLGDQAGSQSPAG
jgi:hypothetical protein